MCQKGIVPFSCGCLDPCCGCYIGLHYGEKWGINEELVSIFAHPVHKQGQVKATETKHANARTEKKYGGGGE